MSATTPGELTAAAVIGLISSGGYSRDVVATIARGFLPLEQPDLIGVLLYLQSTEDEEIASYAQNAFAEIPIRAILEYAADERVAPEHLLRLLAATSDSTVVEALIRNRSVSDGAIAELARRAEPGVQDVIVINQARIIRAPEILEALLENPALSPDARRRALETKEEFFEKKARLELETSEEDEPEILELSLDPIADLLEKAREAGPEPPSVLPAVDADEKDQKKVAFWTRIQFMTVAEKVMVAYRGDRMARMLLVRERNRLVASAVMRNPRMSELEAEAIASMRNVDEEVLRLLGSRRDWMSKYGIMFALVRNPKTPVGVVLPFINRLTLRDLKGLKDDRGVQQVVREMSRKAYIMRTQKK